VSCARPQAPEAAAPNAPPNAVVLRDGVVPAGTLLVVQLAAEVRTDQSKPGDRVRAALVTPIFGGGRRLVPEDAWIVLHVVVSKRGHGEAQPELVLTADSLVCDRRSFPLRAAASGELGRLTPLLGERHREVAVATSLVGGMLLWTPGAVTGFYAGMAAGSVVDAEHPQADARFPMSAFLTLRLLQPFDLRPLREHDGGAPAP
jgi:hypothetical protein